MALRPQREWLLAWQYLLGMETVAIKVIEQEMQEVEPEIAYLRPALSGKNSYCRDIGISRADTSTFHCTDGSREFGGTSCPNINVHPL